MAISQIFRDSAASQQAYLTPALIFVALVATVLIRALLDSKVALSKAPAFVSERVPYIGPLGFWTERWTFFKRAIASSATGNFSFHAGPHMVVGMSGDAARQTFLESRQLGLAEGYTIMMGKMPQTRVVNEHGEDVYPKQEFLTYMKERLKRMTRKEALEHSALPPSPVRPGPDISQTSPASSRTRGRASTRWRPRRSR